MAATPPDPKPNTPRAEIRYFHQPKHVNPATYLGGGYDFGPADPEVRHHHLAQSHSDSVQSRSAVTPSSNSCTPYEPASTRIHLHPTCTGAPNASCVPPPFDGDLLQIMPWPDFQDFTEHDLRAIYEYLKAIPCVQGNYPGEPRQSLRMNRTAIHPSNHQ